MSKIKIFFFLLPIAYLLSCSSRDQEAVVLIEKSIAAHGGMKAWEKIQSISMERDIWMFEENGDTVSYSKQENEFRIQPYSEGKMAWEKDDIRHRVHFDGLKMQYWMGENKIQNEGFLQSKKKDLDAAYYVMSKPFDLLDERKVLSYEGKGELSGGVLVETVKVIDGDPSDSNNDIWWYYFEPNTFELVAYKVKTSDHFSLVYNVEWDRSTGIVFPAKRESFRVDAEGNHLYQRAYYSYSNYKIIQ